MSYKSSIYIKVGKELETELLQVFKKVDLDDCFEKVVEGTDNTEYVRYTADWLKWYADYDDVEAITKFINEHTDRAGLLGIGEDGAQSASEGSPEEIGMYTRTDIDW